MFGAESFDNDDQSDRKCAMQKFKAAEGDLINNIRTSHKQFQLSLVKKDGNYNSNHSLVMRRRFEMSELKITGTIFNYWDNIPSITRSDMMIRGS